MGQEYCSRIFMQPICIIMALNKELVASFHAVWKKLWSECTVEALEGQNSFFFFR